MLCFSAYTSDVLDMFSIELCYTQNNNNNNNNFYLLHIERDYTDNGSPQQINKI